MAGQALLKIKGTNTMRRALSLQEAPWPDFNTGRAHEYLPTSLQLTGLHVRKIALHQSYPLPWRP